MDSDQESINIGDQSLQKQSTEQNGLATEGTIPITNDTVTNTKSSSSSKKKKVHKLSLTETENFNEKLKRRGVVYLSRIPPRMGPTKVKSLLGEYGTVTRVYLEEEDKAKRKRRLRAAGVKGGGGGKRYTEGWVEFEDKKIAKKIAAALNTAPVTNHKRNVHYGDIWNIKYLHKFEWSFLTEKVAYERRVREQKLKIEMMKARKENQEFTSLVEAGKTMDYIEERKRKREEKRKHGDTDSKGRTSGNDKATEQRPTRKFRQTTPVVDGKDKSAKTPVLRSLV